MCHLLSLWLQTYAYYGNFWDLFNWVQTSWNQCTKFQIESKQGQTQCGQNGKRSPLTDQRVVNEETSDKFPFPFCLLRKAKRKRIMQLQLVKDQITDSKELKRKNSFLFWKGWLSLFNAMFCKMTQSWDSQVQPLQEHISKLPPNSLFCFLFSHQRLSFILFPGIDCFFPPKSIHKRGGCKRVDNLQADRTSNGINPHRGTGNETSGTSGLTYSGWQLFQWDDWFKDKILLTEITVSYFSASLRNP